MQILKAIEGGVTIFTVMGAVSVQEIVKQATEDLAAPQTRDAIWDFSLASSVNLSTGGMKQIVNDLTTHAAHVEGRRVALVGAGAIQVGLGKMFKAFAAMAGLPHEYRVFRNRVRAEEWLSGEVA
jgi:hypothetical protein